MHLYILRRLVIAIPTLIGVTHRDQLDVHLAAADAKLPDEALAAVDRLAREIRYPMG